MTLVEKNKDGFDFYIQAGNGDREPLYNITPTGSPAPQGGYRNMAYIERVKGAKFPDRYQPTLHGMRSGVYPHTMEPKTRRPTNDSQ